MELYDTEEQQVEAIKDWWKENGKAIIVGAVIGLGGLFGWRYYQNTQVQVSESASSSYNTVINALDAKGLAAQANVQTFIKANSKQQYSVLAAMQLAKAQVEANKFDDALAQLQWAQSHTKDASLLPLVNYRIARIAAELKKYADANKALTAITDPAWTGRVAELRGDIALRQGKKEEAYTAYTEAQQAKDVGPALQMKLDDLAK